MPVRHPVCRFRFWWKYWANGTRNCSTTCGNWSIASAANSANGAQARVTQARVTQARVTQARVTQARVTKARVTQGRVTQGRRRKNNVRNALDLAAAVIKLSRPA